MDTSLAGERCDAAATLSSDSFFFMSPYRSFTTRGCFRRLERPRPTAQRVTAYFRPRCVTRSTAPAGRALRAP